LLSELEPARALNKLNTLICEHNRKTDRFVTLALAVLDPLDHHITAVSAGHPTPLLYDSATGAWREALPSEFGGMPLGIEDRERFAPFRVRLRPGDLFLWFTDGVTEAADDHRDLFKLEGIYAALERGPCSSASTVGRRVIRTVAAHSEGCPQADDITLVCLGRTS
jgi:sigma-B regulation protein RsbU (phosphoserine phosphatase)